MINATRTVQWDGHYVYKHRNFSKLYLLISTKERTIECVRICGPYGDFLRAVEAAAEEAPGKASGSLVQQCCRGTATIHDIEHALHITSKVGQEMIYSHGSKQISMTQQTMLAETWMMGSKWMSAEVQSVLPCIPCIMRLA